MSEIKNFTDRNNYQTEITCPACGKKSSFTMHALIDTTKDVNAEVKVFNSDYFLHTCPTCHNVQHLSYSCMYHDGERKLLIGFADTDKDYDEMKVTLSGVKQDTKLDEVLSKWLDTCTVRLVRSEMELQEKVLIKHFDLDDRVVEIARGRILKELKDKGENVDFLMFNTIDEGYAFLSFNENGVDKTIGFSKEAYDSIEEEFKDKLKDDSDLEVNAEWYEKFTK